MNPFSEELDPGYLFNIETGKAASSTTEKFLLNVFESGNEERRTFIKECSEDPERLERRIQRKTLHKFASEAGRSRHKLKRADGKVVAACTVRDLFGSSLYHLMQQEIDMAEVLKFPLTIVPLLLSHVDGTMQKTPKATLMKFLESQITTVPPISVNTTIIDASFFLHLQMSSSLPPTFGAIAHVLLQRILSADGDTIHFVSDKWLSPSIKDCERDARVSSTGKYQITGPTQKRPNNWIQALRNASFKESFIKFLINSWKNDDFAHIWQEKTLFANSGDVCYSYKVVDGRVVKEMEVALHSDHEEADSQMFYHLATLQAPNNVVIRISDTDCLVIGLGCYHLLDQSVNVWIEAGLQSNNTQRYISIRSKWHSLPRFIPSFSFWH